MKKILKNIILVVFSVLLSFSLVACLQTYGTDSGSEVESLESSLELVGEPRSWQESKSFLKERGYDVYEIKGRVLEVLQSSYEGVTGGFSAYNNDKGTEITVYVFDTEDQATNFYTELTGYEKFILENFVIFSTEQGMQDAKWAFNVK